MTAKSQMTIETERLNEALELAEKELGARDFSVPASVPLRGGGTLWFRKQGSIGWILVYQRQGTDDFQPLMSASRHVRVATAFALSELYEALRFAQASHLSEVIEATMTARAFVVVGLPPIEPENR